MRGGGAVSVVESVTGRSVGGLWSSGILRRGVTVLRAGGLGSRGTGTFALARIGCTGVSTNPGILRIIVILSRK